MLAILLIDVDGTVFSGDFPQQHYEELVVDTFTTPDFIDRQ